MGNWFKWKSFWLALAAIAGAIGAYAGGEISLQVMLITILGALEAMFIRAGVAKAAKPK
jgi:membrane protein implicated in regulation of membrane protease activity